MGHHRPRVLLTGALFAMATMVALLAWTPQASAYSAYTPAKGGQGNCAACHGDFNGNAGYISLQDADPVTWVTDTMADHSNDMLQATCAACHGSGAKYPVTLSSSNDPTLNLSCSGCHGRAADAGTDTGVADPGTGNPWLPISGTGAGLRQAHFTANRDVTRVDGVAGIVNTQVCADCHADANPVNFTPVDENVVPPYYLLPPLDVVQPTNPCNLPAGTEAIYGSLGLDNDGDGLVDTADAVCNSNSPPVAHAGGPYTATVNTAVPLNGIQSFDPDGDTLTNYSWSLTAVPTGSSLVLGTTSITQDGTASASFTPDRNGDYEVTLTVSDGSLPNDPVADLNDVVTISTTNNAPLANAGGPYSAQSGQTVTLNNASGSDPDLNDTITYAWTLTAKPATSNATLINPATVAPSLTIDVSGTYQATLVVTDEWGLASAPSVATITTTNTPPTASAVQVGTAYVLQLATLDGSSSSDPDQTGEPPQSLTFSWSFTSVPTTPFPSNLTTVDIAQAPSSATATFTPDVPGSYTVQLIVNDGTADSAPTTVTVNTQNTAPVANAGVDQSVAVGVLATLDGTGSTDADEDPRTYAWSFVSGPEAAALNDSTAAKPTFTPNVAGDYIWSLVVNDGTVNSAADQVKIVAGSSNVAPVANAGGTYAAQQGQTVLLDGRASSDVNGDTLTYSWSLTVKPAGSTATLVGPTADQPSFTIDVSGDYTAQLIVNDGSLNSSPDFASISTINSTPTAHAGVPQTVVVGQAVTLDGSASDDVDLDPLTYAWSFGSVPAGSSLTTVNIVQSGVLGDSAASFVPDWEGDYVIQLIVNDGTVASTPSTVTITTGNSAPTADAGLDQPSVPLGGTVNLTGAGNDPDPGDTLTYSWSFSGLPAGSLLTNADIAQSLPTDTTASFVTDVKGNYVVQLIVNDGTVNSAPNTMTATVANATPVANAGVDQNIVDGGLVTLDGSGSYDNDADTLTYNWTITAKPAGSTATINATDPVRPTFVADGGGTYTVRLVVYDGTVNSAADSVNIFNTLTTAEPNIALAPATHDFGAVLVGTTQAKTVAIQNVGTDWLNITGLTMAGADFAYRGPTLPFSLQKGRQVSIEVDYTPSAAGPATPGTLTVTSNDPDTPSASFTLDGAGVTGTPDISLPSATLAFGDAEVGTTQTGVVSIQNIGTATLNVSGLSLTGGNADYALVTSAPLSIAAGYSASVEVRYSPSATGADADTLTIVSDDPVDPSLAVSVSGNGIVTTGTPDINLPSATLAFGDVQIGTTNRSYVDIQNLGSADLNITGLALTGSGDFILSNPPAVPFIIKAGRQIRVKVHYLPSVAGPASASLDIASNDPVTANVAASLSGNALASTATPDINLPTASLVFGDTVVGSTQRGFVDIQNLGGADLSVTGLALTGSGDFILSNPPAVPFIIRSGRQARIKVEYAASVAGPASASLDIASDDPVDPALSASLSGNGIAGTPDINLPAVTLAVGDVEVGASQTGTVLIQNIGTADLTVSGLSLTGGNTDFVLNTAAPFTIPAGYQVPVTVTYSPSATGADVETLQIVSDDPVDPTLSVSLSSNGTTPPAGTQDINLSTTSVAYGDLLVGKMKTMSVAIQNLGTADLNVASLTMTGSADFALAAGTPTAFVVLPGRQLTVKVNYSPSATGAASGSLAITSDDPVDPSLSVSLSGNGLVGVADINLPVVSYDYGDVIVGASSSGYIAIQNPGTADLTVTGLALTGSADFALAAGTPTTFVISAGRQVTIQVNYTPPATGIVGGTLTVTSDDPVTPSVSVTLSGNGAPAV